MSISDHDFIARGIDCKSDKEYCFRKFNEQVVTHINTYVVPQYGDNGDDPASQYTVDDLKKQIQKYAARIGSNARGPEEAVRDCLKMAHYSQMLHDLLSYNAHERDMPADYG